MIDEPSDAVFGCFASEFALKDNEATGVSKVDWIGSRIRLRDSKKVSTHSAGIGFWDPAPGLQKGIDSLAPGSGLGSGSGTPKRYRLLAPGSGSRIRIRDSCPGLCCGTGRSVRGIGPYPESRLSRPVLWYRQTPEKGIRLLASASGLGSGSGTPKRYRLLAPGSGLGSGSGTPKRYRLPSARIGFGIRIGDSEKCIDFTAPGPGLGSGSGTLKRYRLPSARIGFGIRIGDSEKVSTSQRQGRVWDPGPGPQLGFRSGVGAGVLPVQACVVVQADP
ncbi:hypothetical protein R1sor_023019 [Riccia sorocarpa]|uniref:Ribosomal protein L2 n=1 Tax=Riccia sorocarpa TaxID=122646 RepID=A0ABD3GM94_9MARC